MLSSKNCKIICIILTIIIVLILIRAFTNQGKLWDYEYYRLNQNCDQVCSNPVSSGECEICKIQQSIKK
jgi:hypothetical protein